MQNVNEAPTFIHQFNKDDQIISTQDLSVFYGGTVQNCSMLVFNLRKRQLQL